MTTEQSLFAICNEVSQLLATVGEERSCIRGSALLLRVLHKLGYRKAYPLTVRVEIFPPAFLKWVKEHGPPLDEASGAACEAEGGITIAIGHRSKGVIAENLWAGHLAVVVPNAYSDRHALLDLTIVQANRPELGVSFPPMCLRVRHEFVTGKQSFKAEVLGCRVVYEAFPDDHGYEDADAWTEQDDLQVGVDYVVNRLKTS